MGHYYCVCVCLKQNYILERGIKYVMLAVWFVIAVCLDNQLTTLPTHKPQHAPEQRRLLKTSQCLRMNRAQLRDPVLERACLRSAVCYEDLGLPREMTIWVDPGEVSCRYGERSVPFCVMQLQGCHQGDKEFSRRIHNAVERAASDIQSGCSDEEGGDTSMNSSCSSLSTPCPAHNPKPKTIPTVSNPNSVYQVTNQFSEFAPVPPPPAWAAYSNRRAFPGDGYPPHGPPSGGLFAQQHSSQFQPPKGIKPYRATSSFTGPRQDKYHWVSKNRS